MKFMIPLHKLVTPATWYSKVTKTRMNISKNQTVKKVIDVPNVVKIPKIGTPYQNISMVSIEIKLLDVISVIRLMPLFRHLT